MRSQLPARGALPLLLAALLQPTPSEGQLRFNRLIVVAAGVDTSDNCDRLVAALDGITDSSADNRYLVRLQPGTYICASRVNVPPFVTLEGVGTEASRILGRLDNNSLGLVNLSSDSELRHVFVQNRWDTSGAQPQAAMIAVSAVAVGTPVERVRLVNVVAQAFSIFPIDTFGVKATGADIEVLRSRVFSELSGSSAATTAVGSISIAYSRIGFGDVAGNVTCRYSFRGFAAVDENCL